MYESLSLILGEEDGLFSDLTGGRNDGRNDLLEPRRQVLAQEKSKGRRKMDGVTD
jgi:hypothetical protein